MPKPIIRITIGGGPEDSREGIKEYASYGLPSRRRAG